MDVDDEDARIVPGVTVTALAGGNGVLELTALTLTEERGTPRIYASLRNEGDVPACSAAFSLELFDREGSSLAAGITGLLARRFYLLGDGSGAVAACIGPGDVAIAAVTELPADLALDAVATVVYRCPYFALDVVPVAGLAVDELEAVSTSGGTRYRGALVNDFDFAVARPSVTVFATNRVGRPLAMATADTAHDLAPGARWRFETTQAGVTGAGFAAYPAGALALSSDLSTSAQEP